MGLMGIPAVKTKMESWIKTIPGTPAYELGQAEKAADELAAAPGIAAEKARQAVIRRRRASVRTQSVRTSPLGIAGEAQTAKKTLLGL